MESLIVYPNYTEPYEFEKYDFQQWNRLMTDYWHVSVSSSAVYLTLIYFGQKWMATRKPFDLRGILLWWNVVLSIFSWFMFIRLLPELFNEIHNYGVYHSLCNRDLHTVTTSFWALVFTLSKILEFGDTAFIVLRKQPLQLLHWYHHITVAMYTFYTCGNFDPAGRWFGTMNSFIHFIMYGYYALKSIGFKVPRRFAMVVTSMQIFQMFVGLTVNIISLVGKAGGNECIRPYRNIFWALMMYGSYFILFLQFFKKAYSKKSADSGKTKKSQ